MNCGKATYVHKQIEELGDNGAMVAEPNIHSSKMPFLGSRKALAILCASLTLIFGSIGIAVLDIGHAPDIWTHTYRIASILNGDIIAHPVNSVSYYHSDAAQNWGGAVSKEIVDLSLDNYNGHDPGVVFPESLPPTSNGNLEVPFNNTAIYTPLSYVPQIAGFAIGSLMGLDATAQYYLAEIVMLVVWSIIAGFSVWIIPRHRIAYMVMTLCPLLWFPYSFAISADSLLLAEMLLYIALVYKALLVKSTVPSIIGATLLGFLIAISKPSYLPFPILLIVALALRKDRKMLWIALAGLFAAIAFDLFWLRLNSGIATSPTMVSLELIAERTADVFALIPEVLVHFVYSVLHLQASYLIGTETVLVFWLVLGASLILLIASVYKIHLQQKSSNPNTTDTTSERLLIDFLACGWVIVLATTMLVYAALWLQYTPANEPGIVGIQYRYFLPFLPFGLIMVLDLIGILKGKRLTALSQDAACA